MSFFFVQTWEKVSLDYSNFSSFSILKSIHKCRWTWFNWIWLINVSMTIQGDRKSHFSQKFVFFSKENFFSSFRDDQNWGKRKSYQMKIYLFSPSFEGIFRHKHSQQTSAPAHRTGNWIVIKLKKFMCFSALFIFFGWFRWDSLFFSFSYSFRSFVSYSWKSFINWEVFTRKSIGRVLWCVWLQKILHLVSV